MGVGWVQINMIHAAARLASSVHSSIQTSWWDQISGIII